jgi:hypothetical protein
MVQILHIRQANLEEDSLGDQDNQPICKGEVQWSKMQKESQPWE